MCSSDLGLDTIKYLHSDGSGELDKCCRDLEVLHNTSEVGQPQANDIAERQVNEAKMGAATNLSQARLVHQYWNYALRHWQVTTNVVSRVSGRGIATATTPWELRFRSKFPGEVMPFWG